MTTEMTASDGAWLWVWRLWHLANAHAGQVALYVAVFAVAAVVVSFAVMWDYGRCCGSKEATKKEGRLGPDFLHQELTDFFEWEVRTLARCRVRCCGILWRAR